jgi:hypothetical protein
VGINGDAGNPRPSQTNGFISAQWRLAMKKIFLVFAITAFCTVYAGAQTADADDNQSWNDLQITVAISRLNRHDFTVVSSQK